MIMGTEDDTSVSITFSLIGENFDPNYITSVLKINPTNFYRKGDKVSDRNNLIRKEDVWEFSTGYITCLDIELAFEIIIEKFEEKIQVISEMINEYNLFPKIFIVIHVENNQVPAQYYNKKILNFLFAIKAELDVDLYIYS
jgi:hypothetical protein